MDRPSSHFRGRPVSGLEAAHANEYFDPFLNATTLKNILGYYRSMCEFLHLKPNVLPQFYPKLRANLTTWRAKALWKKFDARASHKCYGKGKICANTRVLIIGAGPCGLRTAIEAQLLGAKVVVIEKRDRLSRNNVLHLWPFVIEDLRMLGAKKFFGKFCAGAIDHISIRQLQCIMLKVALLLGVEIHTEVSFEKLVEPSATEKTGWRAAVIPENHPVSQYEFDVIIGADGKRNTLQGFKRKEFRGKLAIAITANFINKKTEAEARVEEISGVAFIFNQKFFKDLQEETRIDLENIVYYKDDTHYFVMTAKKASLLEKGVILQDLADTEKLLAPDNVDRDALQNYAREAADFSTNYQMPDLEFAVNHYGQPDVAMFDFTSMYAAEYASKVIEKNGSKVLMILVGDSLLEPFWPTGSGCARGFLSSLDAAWAIRSWSLGTFTPLDVLAERESIYRLLAQTTPDNLNKDWKSYTLDPATRYPNLNKTVVLPHQTICLYETDNPNSIERMKRTSHEGVRHEVPKKRRRGNVDNEVLLSWLAEQLREHEDIQISDISSVFRDGKVLCAIIHHYRPDLVDYVSIQDEDPALKNQLAVDILEKDLGVPPIMTGDELTHTEDYLGMASYLTQVYDTFRGEIPHIKHPKLSKKKQPSTKSPEIPSKSPVVPPFFIENRKIQVTSITNIKKETQNRNRQEIKSNSDEMVTSKKKVVRIKVKKRPGDQLSLADIKKSFSEVYFNKDYGETKSSNNMDLFDLTYGDQTIDENLRKLKVLFDGEKDFSDRGDGNKTVIVGRSEAEKAYRYKNVSPSLQKFLNKATKKNRIDLQKSKLSVIPETIDEKVPLARSDSFVPPLEERAESNDGEKYVKEELKENVNRTSEVSYKIDKILERDHDIQQLALPRIPSPKVSSEIFTKPSMKANEKEKTTFRKQSIHQILHHEETYRKIFKVKQKLKNYLERSLSNSWFSNSNVVFLRPPKKDRNLPLEPDNTFVLSPLLEPFRSSKKVQLHSPAVPSSQVVHKSQDLSKKVLPKKQHSNTTSVFQEKHVFHKYEHSCCKVPTEKHHSNTTNKSSKLHEQVLEKKNNNLVAEIVYKSKSKTTVDRKTISTAQSSVQEIFPKKLNLKQKISYRTLAKSSVTKIASKNSSNASLEIRVIEKSRDNTITCQKIQFKSSMNLVTISSKARLSKQTFAPFDCCGYGRTGRCDSFIYVMPEVVPSKRLTRFPIRSKYSRRKIQTNNPFDTGSCDSKIPVGMTRRDVDIISRLGGLGVPTSQVTCQRAATDREHFQKFPSKKKMSASEIECLPHEIYSRVSNWISSHDFKTVNDDRKKDFEGETILTNDISTDITSVTRAMARNKHRGEYDDIKIEERTDVVRCETSSSGLNMTDLLRTVKESPVLKNASKFTHYSSFNAPNFRSSSAPPATFSIIVEGEESVGSRRELPESNKRSEFSFKTIKSSNHNILQPSIPTVQQSRPSSRHKRHADAITQKPGSIDRKMRKRRTLEKVGPNGMLSFFLRVLMDTSVVALLLFLFDIIINPEQYGYRHSVISNYLSF